LNLPNASREGNHSSLVKFTIFSQGSSPRFFASGRSIYFFEIQSLHLVKICTLTPFPYRIYFFEIQSLHPVKICTLTPFPDPISEWHCFKPMIGIFRDVGFPCIPHVGR